MKERKKYRGKETKPAVPRPAVPSLNLPTTPRPIFMMMMMMMNDE